MMKGDWDFAVYFSEFKLEYIADLTYSLSRHLRVREDEVDIVPLNAFDSLPCAIVLEILRNGKVLYYDDEAREWLRMSGMCGDSAVKEPVGVIASLLETLADYTRKLEELKLTDWWSIYAGV